MDLKLFFFQIGVREEKWQSTIPRKNFFENLFAGGVHRWELKFTKLIEKFLGSTPFKAYKCPIVGIKFF